MATYKLIQDIEAEDHILGPLSLRQFIFALISIFCFYICFILVTKHVAFLLILFLPPALFFGFFAVPFGRDQPTEVWALAKIRFYLKPRKRLWDQSGMKELVTINVPKKVERVFTDGLDQYEVKSRLSALANTLDSRGWAVKNAGLGPAIAVSADDSERLVDLSRTSTEPADLQIPAEADVLDESDGTLSQHFDDMINQNNQAHHQELIERMNAAPAPQPPPPVQQANPYPYTPPQMQLPPTPPSASPSAPSDNQWFMPHIDNAIISTVSAPDVAAQQESTAEAALAEQLRAQHSNQQVYSNNLRTLQPLSSQQQTPQTMTPPPQLAQTNAQQYDDTQLTDQPDPAIISLANNNDFTVDTIAREAKRAKGDEIDEDEVVIPLR